MTDKNRPFEFGVATSGVTFTDRVKETERLLNNFRYGINTILISPRRLGKTSLVNKVTALAKQEKIIVISLDIFACRSEYDFVNAYSTAIIKATASKLEEWITNARHFFTRFSPKVSFSDDPLHDFSISLDYNGEAAVLEDVLAMPERIAVEKKQRVVVCMDEFQQVGEFDDSITFQKKLRTTWQHQQHVSYCLYGSKKHLMATLFGERNKPFYKFGETLFLDRIGEEDWADFIMSRFKAYDKNISRELSVELCRKVGCYSSYVQQLAWLLWLQTEKEATADGLENALQSLINDCSPIFYMQTEGLTSYQMNFLYAMLNGVKDGFTQKDVLSRFRLGTAANIKRIKNTLINKEIIDIDSKGCIVFADPVFPLWLKELK